MEGLWSKAIKATGSVGVVAFLFYTVLNYLFSEQVVTLFGSEKMFMITIVTIAALLILLLIAILKTKEQPGGPKVTYSDHSNHNGDNNF